MEDSVVIMSRQDAGGYVVRSVCLDNAFPVGVEMG